MSKKFLVMILIISTLLSCSLDDDDNSNFSLKTLPIKEAVVPTSFDFGQSHEITVFYDLPDGCHSFRNLFYQQEGTSRIVAINALVDNESACTEAIIEEEFTFAVKVTQSQDYTFKFWKGTNSNGDDIFEEVIVTVNP